MTQGQSSRDLTRQALAKSTPCPMTRATSYCTSHAKMDAKLWFGSWAHASHWLCLPRTPCGEIRQDHASSLEQSPARLIREQCVFFPRPTPERSQSACRLHFANVSPPSQAACGPPALEGSRTGMCTGCSKPSCCPTNKDTDVHGKGSDGTLISFLE